MSQSPRIPVATDAAGPAPAEAPPRRPNALVRFAPLAVIAVALVVAYASGVHKLISLDTLAANFDAMRTAIAERPVLAGVVFVIAYSLAVTISLPGALWFTIASGALFGWGLGAAYAWAGALTGATLIFLAARTALGDMLRAKAGSNIDQFKRGFEGDAFFYILLLRLIPLPFFLVNVAPAFFKVKVRDYVGATAIGILPGGVAYAGIGAGVGEIIARGEEVNLATLAEPRLWIGVAILAVLTITGLVLKKRRGPAGAPAEGEAS